MRVSFPLRLLALASFALFVACTVVMPPATNCGSELCTADQVCVANHCAPTNCDAQQCRASEACYDEFCAAETCRTVDCPVGERCVRGGCFPKDCAALTCGVGQVCVNEDCFDRGCVQADGSVVSCGPGQLCADGVCRDVACAGLVCGPGNVCVEGACITVACVGVTCPAGTACATGACLPTACGSGAACTAGQVCHDQSCVDAACLGVSCPMPYVCSQGACQSICSPACGPLSVCHGTVCYSRECGATVCLSGQVCVDGQCADEACVGVTCTAPQSCINGACTDQCVIGGQRIADQTPNPSDDCLRCDVTQSRTAWSPAPDGLTCADDLNACTQDTCVAGLCRHDALPDDTSCGSALVCEAGRCAAGCTIAQTFFADGTVNPSNPCEQCVVASSTTAWSPKSGVCPDDGNSCTDDVCMARVCSHPAQSNGTACGAGLLCASGSCGAQCSIGGVTWGNGATNPANECQSCQSSVSTSSWTAKAVNVACTADTNACTNDVCDGAGSCAHPPTVAGTSCPSRGVCLSSTKVQSGFQCDGAGACRSTSSTNCGSAGPCRTGGGCLGGQCKPLVNKPDGTVCNGGGGECCHGTCRIPPGVCF